MSEKLRLQKPYKPPQKGISEESLLLALGFPSDSTQQRVLESFSDQPQILLILNGQGSWKDRLTQVALLKSILY